MQTNPCVSIIVPIYNTQAYLDQCLQSVINQSYKNLDIILVDDESTDKSLELALEYAKKDERIFIISKPNYGQASARNAGLEFIKGSALRDFFESKTKKLSSYIKNNSFDKKTKNLDQKLLEKHFTKLASNHIKTNLRTLNELIIQELPDNLIHFVDSDDYLRKDCIKNCVETMLKKDLELCVHDLINYYEASKELKAGEFLKNIQKKYYEKGMDFLNENKLYDFYFAWQGMFKAQILNRYNLRFNCAIYHEDHDFGILLFALANKLLKIDDKTYIYRNRTHSTMSSQKNKEFPKKLPHFLEPLRKDFKDYKELRAYFKAYCFCIVALRIWEFYKEQDEVFVKKYQVYFEQSILGFLKIFKSSLKNDPLGIKELLKIFTFSRARIFTFFIKDLHRQPKKLRFIANLRYFNKG